MPTPSESSELTRRKNIVRAASSLLPLLKDGETVTVEGTTGKMAFNFTPQEHHHAQA